MIIIELKKLVLLGQFKRKIYQKNYKQQKKEIFICEISINCLIVRKIRYDFIFLKIRKKTFSGSSKSLLSLSKVHYNKFLINLEFDWQLLQDTRKGLFRFHSTTCQYGRPKLEVAIKRHPYQLLKIQVSSESRRACQCVSSTVVVGKDVPDGLKVSFVTDGDFSRTVTKITS